MRQQQINFQNPGEIFALNLTIVKPEKLTYRTLLGFIGVYRKKAAGRFPDLIEFTPELLGLFLRDIVGEGDAGDEFLCIKCILEQESVESQNVIPSQ